MNKYGIYLLLLCTLFSCGHQAYAQGENNNWNFGYGHQISFNNNTTTYNASSSIHTLESSATASDAQGNLLFYTIGCRIWDRNGNEMPNATGLKGNGSMNLVTEGSGVDAVQIVPLPGNPDQFYIFSASALEDYSDTIYYHIVDMSLNGGLGDVIPATKNTVLFAGGANAFREFTLVAYGECNSYWYIVNMGQDYDFAFYAYKIDEFGVWGTPVVSVPNTNEQYVSWAGNTKMMRKSPVAYRTSKAGLMRSNFNRTTGQFSNYEVIPNTIGYNFEVSANEQLLYLTTTSGLKQYNLALYPNLSAIGSSAINLTSSPHGDIRRGPDGKIYFHQLSNNSLFRIEQPDVPGTACTITPQYINLSTTVYGYTKLGATLLRRTGRDTLHTSTRTINQYCPGDTITVAGRTQAINDYIWSDGSTTADKKITQPGRYWVKSIRDECYGYLDTFIVNRIEIEDLMINDTTICNGAQLTLDAYRDGLEHYLWSDGSTGPVLTVRTAGTYYVTAQAGPCTFTDTVKIDIVTPLLHIAQQDTLICTGSPLYLTATTNMGSAIYWNTGHKGTSITVDRAGNYRAYTENKCGAQADTVRIEDFDCNCNPIVPNAFTPNGDGRNDIFMPVFNPDCDALYYELKIYNRYGQLVYMTNRKGTGWDGTYSNKRPADAGAYFYTISLTNRYGDTERRLHKGDIMVVR